MYFLSFYGHPQVLIQPDLSSSNVLCFIAIVAIVSFEQINQLINHNYHQKTAPLATIDQRYTQTHSDFCKVSGNKL